MVISPLIGDNQWTKYHYLLWLELMILGIQKVAIYLCVVSQQGSGSGKRFLPIKLYFN